ncbi:MAG: DUF817 domain-containing protein [Hyphomicrobiaceae bacterium]|nr:DUF817 domain-containing protein [Hyphomicrobiaceae bacterium]
MNKPSALPSAGHRPSAARHYPLLARLIAREAILARWAGRRTATLIVHEFVRFGIKQAWACLFGGMMLALLLATHLWYPRDAALARYDFLVVSAVLIQIGMIRFGLETWEEAKVILIFHVVGTLMEIFKTAVGSWIYPEPGLLKVAGVPLFSGFMYAAVGSYIARAWRLFDFEFTRHPPLWALAMLSFAIYINFFLHHYWIDVRLALFVAAGVLLGPSLVHFRIHRKHRAMPLLVGLLLVAIFIWFAENIGTFARAWVYPNQKAGWEMVSVAKLGSWFLLMLISYTLVAAVHGVVRYRRPVGSLLPPERSRLTPQEN